MTGRWRFFCGLALGLAVGCGRSSKDVFAPDDAGAAGEVARAPLGDEGGTGGASGEGGRVDAGNGGAGTGATSGGAGGAGGACEAGEPGSSGLAGSGSTSCPTEDQGEAGEGNKVLWIGRPELGSEPPLCVPDCTSADYAPARREGCEWICPETAPVPAKSCELRCNEWLTCGPGLYCDRATLEWWNEPERCIWLTGDDSDCQCRQVPESCDAEEERWLCGRDGKTYPNFCEAERARTSLVGYADEADCTLDDERFFKCGGIFCERGSEYCIISVETHDDHGLDNFRCVTSPCASNGGCSCVLAEIGLDEEPRSCSDSDPEAIVVGQSN